LFSVYNVNVTKSQEK